MAEDEIPKDDITGAPPEPVAPLNTEAADPARGGQEAVAPIQPESAPEPEPHPVPSPAAPVPPPPPAAEPPRVAAPAVALKPRRWSWRRIGLAAVALVILGPPVLALVYRFVPPPGTILMVQRAIEGHGWDYRWRPLSQISPALVDAAVASEDANFCTHHGFDFQAMQKAMQHNERRPNRIKGGSTISQQTAKNVFLWPDRTYVRKALEAADTVLIEAVWGKRRIMEVYLNVVEFGPGVYGAQAASQTFFHEDAGQLTPAQAARLVAVLPRPLKWSAEAPGRYVAGRSRKIDGRIGTVREAGLAGCVGR